MFQFLVFVALLAFAAATAVPGIISTYNSRPGYIAPPYSAYSTPLAPLALSAGSYGYTNIGYSGYSPYALPYAYRY